MREQSLILAGLLAMCVVSAIALVRLVAVLRTFRRQRRGLHCSSNRYLLPRHGSGNSSVANGAGSPADAAASSRILLPSLVFHVLVFLCLATEVPVYACRYASFYSVGRPLYALHLASYLLLFSAFCVIVTLWSDVAVFEPNEWTVLMNRCVG